MSIGEFRPPTFRGGFQSSSGRLESNSIFQNLILDYFIQNIHSHSWLEDIQWQRYRQDRFRAR